MEVTTSVFTSITPELLADWTALWEQSPFASYSNAPAWFLSLHDTFENLSCTYTALYNGERLQAIIPLVQHTSYGISTLGLFPEDFVCGVPILLAHDDPALFTAVGNVMAHMKTILLPNVPGGFAQKLCATLPESKMIESSVNYSLQLTKDSNNQIIVPQRSVLMRRVRENEDDFTLQFFSGASSHGLAIAFAIDEESRKKSRGYNVFSDRKIKAFYQSLAKHFQEHFTVNVLYYQEKPIAYEIGFVVGKAYFGSQIAFLAEYAHYSPGKVLAVRLLESFASRDIDLIDFGSGDSHIKHLLTKNFQPLYRIIISEHKIIKKYLTLLYQVKHTGYTTLQNHKTIYTMYRTMRKIKLLASF